MQILLRGLMGLFVVSWWVLPAMGVIDLTVTWDREWPVVLEAGWGVLFTVGTGGALLVAAARPQLARSALVQLLVITTALLVAAVVGHEPETWWIFAMLAIQLPLLRLLAPAPIARSGRDVALLALGGLAALPGIAYAWWCLDQNRQTLPHGDITNDVDHFSVQGALALVLVALPIVAGLCPATRRLLGTSTALMAGYLGLVSVAWPDAIGGFGPAWSIATMTWAGAVLVAAWWPAAGRGPVTDAHERVQVRA